MQQKYLILDLHYYSMKSDFGGFLKYPNILYSQSNCVILLLNQ
jgi:hypothetical protein